MKLLIVSGLSGAGKSIVLGTLEDCGYYCIDNFPVMLLEDFIDHVMLRDKNNFAKTAISIDARNQRESLVKFGACLDYIRNKGIECQVFFLQADESTLLKRYSETRRRHPLTNHELPLKEAIKAEQKILETIAVHADFLIDTSRMLYHELRELIKATLGERNQPYLSLQFQSFGFKYGIPLDADFLFDARSLPNPYWEHDLRGLTGKDQAVVNFLQGETVVQSFYRDIANFLENWIPQFEAENRCYLTVAVGCTGGQHRSVYLVDCLVKHFQKAEYKIIVQHRELPCDAL